MSTTAPAFEFDFFISRRGTVAAAAQEVADILQSEGYRVLMQDYDAAPGGSFPPFIHDALTKARHLLVRHSADYDSTHWTRQEFANFLAVPDARVAERRIACCAAMPPTRAGCSPAWSTAACTASPIRPSAIASSSQ